MAYQLVNLATSFGLKLDSNRPTRLTVLGGLVRQSQPKNHEPFDLLVTWSSRGIFWNPLPPLSRHSLVLLFQQDVHLFHSHTSQRRTVLEIQPVCPEEFRPNHDRNSSYNHGGYCRGKGGNLCLPSGGLHSFRALQASGALREGLAVFESDPREGKVVDE